MRDIMHITVSKIAVHLAVKDEIYREISGGLDTQFWNNLSVW